MATKVVSKFRGNIKKHGFEKKRVVIDFLYLDLDTCARCQGTDRSLNEALSDVSRVLEAANYEVAVNKINVNTEEMALKYKFQSSPTIRVNGNDIQMEFKESLCESCGDVCGSDVDCRVWLHQGREYTEPPKALIIKGILKGVFGERKELGEETCYEVPENLKKFYSSLEKKKSSAAMNIAADDIPISIQKEKHMKDKIKVAFVCVHNSCRSQMAEAISKILASDVFEAYSAGTETKPQINQDAVAVVKDIYGVDMNQTQRSKLLSEIPAVDIVITMGCNVDCPYLPCQHREDWGLEDPTGKDREEFVRTAKKIESKVADLKERITKGIVP